MSYSLNSELYLLPTPAGAFNAVAGPSENRLARFLVELLRNAAQSKASDQNLQKWSGLDNCDEAREFLWRTQELGWVQALPEAPSFSDAPLERLSPELLPHLGMERKVLLADTQGCYLYSHGFPHEVAEELSALSADLASLHMRRSGSLNRNLGLGGSSWGLIDSAGQSKLGFWPIFAGEQRFVLVIAGTPTFNRQELVDLIWVLYQRYNLPNRLSK